MGDRTRLLEQRLVLRRQLGPAVDVDQGRAADRAQRHVRGVPLAHLVGAVGLVGVGRREGRGIDRAALERGVDFGRVDRGRDGADLLHRSTDAGQRAHAHALEVIDALGCLAAADELVVGQQRGQERLGVPARELLHHQRVVVEGHMDLLLHRRVLDRQEGQVERREHRQLLRMVGGADVGHLQAADLQEVQKLLGLAEALVADLDLELAAGALVHELAQRLDVLGGRARLAPGGELPFHLGPIDDLRLGERITRPRNYARCHHGSNSDAFETAHECLLISSQHPCLRPAC